MFRPVLLVIAMMLAPLGAQAGTVTIFAAASLRGALDDVARAYEARDDATRLVISYAGSSALARQIDAGAPADIFISADDDWMDYVAAKKLIRPATRQPLLGNSLVLIAPAAAKTAPFPIVAGFPLRLQDGRLAMASTTAVPAGKYGKAALQTLGVWGTVADRVAEAENVRAALAFVARGEAPFGIVYGTDARAEPLVTVAGIFPAGSHPPIVYPVALLGTSKEPKALAVLAFLKGSVARDVFERHGFTIP